MIGYVLKMFPRFSETFILAELLELERRGRPVIVLSLKKPDDGKFHEDLARLRAPVHYLPEHLRCAPLCYARSHARALRRAPATYLREASIALGLGPEARKAFVRAPMLAESARAGGCTQLHAHFASLPALTAMFASRLSSIPFSFTAHAKDIFLDDRSPRLLSLLVRRATAAVTVSDYNVRFIERFVRPGTRRGHVRRIYNGIDLERIASLGRPGPGPAIPRILAVGRLVEKKGFDDLVRSAATLRDRGVGFTCEIVGKGPLHDGLARTIARHGLEDCVRLVGPLPRGEVLRKMGEATVLAVPCVCGSDGNRDGLPTVILEAMACGLPVVATRVTGIPEAVADDETGFVVDERDVDALADRLGRVLQDRNLRRRLGRTARERVRERFDLRVNVGALEAVWDVRPPRDGAATAAVGPVLGSRP